MQYKALMDGLECNEILFSQIDLGDRFDSDYYTKNYLQISRQLKKAPTKKLGALSSAVASAFYPAATQLYSTGDTAFARCVDCIHHPVITKLQEDTFEKIPYRFAIESNGISLLKQEDIIITKVGTPCYASIITEYETLALSRTVLGITDIHDIDPYYLMAFLRCKYGFLQLLRQRELTIQYQLTLPRVKKIEIFIPEKPFQKAIRNLCLAYQKLIVTSKALYDEAEEQLSCELNLPKLPSHTICTKQLSHSFSLTGRLDAEYYQPKYDVLFHALKHLPCRKLGGTDGLVHIMKSIEPGSAAYQEEGIPFIRISDVSKFALSDPEIYLSENIADPASSLFPKKDTILFSKDGSVGIAYKLEQDATCITSGALLHLTIKNKSELLPDYLTLVLNSKVVQLQAERDANGAIIQHWKMRDIENVMIPVLAMDIQKKIASKVHKSFSLRRQADNLFQYIKHAIELAIEQNEANALEWLDNKTQKG